MAELDFRSLAALAAAIKAKPEDERSLDDWRVLFTFQELLTTVAVVLGREGWQEARECLAFAEELQKKRGRPLSKRLEAKRPKSSSGKPGRPALVSNAFLERIIEAERKAGREPQQAELAGAIFDFLAHHLEMTPATKTLKHRLSALGVRPEEHAGRGQRRGPQSRRK